jgi:hypothetical protein
VAHLGRDLLAVELGLVIDRRSLRARRRRLLHFFVLLHLGRHVREDHRQLVLGLLDLELAARLHGQRLGAPLPS